MGEETTQDLVYGALYRVSRRVAILQKHPVLTTSGYNFMEASVKGGVLGSSSLRLDLGSLRPVYARCLEFPVIIRDSATVPTTTLAIMGHCGQ